MSMGRYLCHGCYTIVQYGEKHPCLFFKDDDEVYTVPPPNELEEMVGRPEETEGTFSANSNQNNLNIGAAAQKNHNEGCKERNSSVIENYERITLVPASRRKRRSFSMFPSFRGITSISLDSECASNTNIERDDHKDGEKRSKGQRKRKSASAEATQIVESSSIGMATCSSTLGSVAHGEGVNVAGPSEIQTQSLGSENAKPFVCDVCGKGFAILSNLDRHRRTHTGEKRFTCPTCGKGVNQKSDLERHIRTHTGEKPFECEFCTKRFARKNVLDCHVRTHTGEKPYKCKWCFGDFADSSNYRKHLKNIHGEE